MAYCYTLYICYYVNTEYPSKIENQSYKIIIFNILSCPMKCLTNLVDSSFCSFRSQNHVIRSVFTYVL